MNDDRRTKTQILAELASAQKTVSELEKRIPEPPRAVPVATALAGCIRALDAIPSAKARNSYESHPGPDAVEVAQVLRHLISRYGVDVTVRIVEPCQRVHVEDASDEVLIDRIRGRF